MVYWLGVTRTRMAGSRTEMEVTRTRMAGSRNRMEVTRMEVWS